MDSKAGIIGLWENELGSYMKITACSSEGKIDGVYCSPVGKTIPKKEYLLTGFWKAEKGLVTFSVMWDASLSTWIGNLETDRTLKTTWILQRTGDWDGKMTGTNVFTKTK